MVLYDGAIAGGLPAERYKIIRGTRHNNVTRNTMEWTVHDGAVKPEVVLSSVYVGASKYVLKFQKSTRHRMQRLPKLKLLPVSGRHI